MRQGAAEQFGLGDGVLHLCTKQFSLVRSSWWRLLKKRWLDKAGFNLLPHRGQLVIDALRVFWPKGREAIKQVRCGGVSGCVRYRATDYANAKARSAARPIS